MRRLARRPTVLHDRTIFAVVGIVLGCGIEKVGRRHPVDAVRNVRFFVRVVAQLAIGIRIVRVVAHPLHRDVPVAVAQNAGDHFAARVERVGEPARGSHKGIFAVRAPDRTDDLGRGQHDHVAAQAELVELQPAIGIDVLEMDQGYCRSFIIRCDRMGRENFQEEMLCRAAYLFKGE